MSNLLFFDTETTGIPAKGHYDNPDHPQTPKLVELAAILFSSTGERLAEHVATIRPDGFEIPVAASNVHGITTERALAEGIPLEAALGPFLAMFEDAAVLIAHNLQYDWLVIRRAFKDSSLPPPKNRNEITRFCTKDATTDICRIPAKWGSGWKWPTLMEAHLHFFNEEFSGAHGALADVEACARIYFALKKLKHIEAL